MYKNNVIDYLLVYLTKLYLSSNFSKNVTKLTERKEANY